MKKVGNRAEEKYFNNNNSYLNNVGSYMSGIANFVSTTPTNEKEKINWVGFDTIDYPEK